MKRREEAEQTPEEIARGLQGFLAEHPRALVLEDGVSCSRCERRKYRLATEPGRCTLHHWSEERNLVRRVSAAVFRNGAFRLSAHRFGQTKSQTPEFLADRDRRSLSARETTRERYVHVLERVRPASFRSGSPMGCGRRWIWRRPSGQRMLAARWWKGSRHGQ